MLCIIVVASNQCFKNPSQSINEDMATPIFKVIECVSEL